jgi:hypothetical protein
MTVPGNISVMQGTELPTFRATCWPAEPPDTPGVPVDTLRQHLEHPDSLVVGGGGGMRWVKLPPDFVWRELLEVDPHDGGDVQAFCERWGLLCPPGPDAFAYYADPTATHPGLADLARPAGAARSHDWSRAPIVLIPVLVRHLVAAQAMARHLLLRTQPQGRDVGAVAAAWHQVAGDLAAAGDAAAVLDRCDYLWGYYVNAGLQAFTVHVVVNDEEGPYARPTVPNLYNVICLELARQAVAGQKVKLCANERCGRPFTRQRGRAREDYAQFRSRGVRYCSHLCAKAQSERDRRRRRHEDKS